MIKIKLLSVTEPIFHNNLKVNGKNPIGFVERTWVLLTSRKANSNVFTTALYTAPISVNDAFSLL